MTQEKKINTESIIKLMKRLLDRGNKQILSI